jgi:hypothetical protein
MNADPQRKAISKLLFTLPKSEAILADFLGKLAQPIQI